MALESTHIDAPLEAAREALADGWRYSDWEVGSRHVRDVDAGWPAPGTRIHHTVSFGPLSWNDETEVIEADEPRRRLLEARLHGSASEPLLRGRKVESLRCCKRVAESRAKTPMSRRRGGGARPKVGAKP